MATVELGRIGKLEMKDLEIKGETVKKATIQLAMRRGKDKTAWIQVDYIGRNAEIIEQYSGVGQQILVTGTLEMDTWNDKTTGEKRSKLYLRGTGVELVGSKGAGEAPADEAPPSGPEADEPGDEIPPF